MSSSREPRGAPLTGQGPALKAWAGALACGLAGLAWAAPPSTAETFSGIGRAATPKEVAAWDIDVRPDFKGLPPGKGTVAQGMEVWEAKCASCHGIFGESNEVFSPVVGGTTKDDVRTGRVARLLDDSFPGRTTMMKLSTLSTLWDYIYRAMPWNAPKSLSVDETYAVTAYILNMANVLPDNFTLSHQNMAQVQQWLPNRNGKTTAHAMWPGRSLTGGTARPDVMGTACMTNCATEPKVASFLPDHARNAHGNLAEQNRLIGPQVGADTTRPAGTRPAGAATAAAALAAAPAATASPAAAALALATKHNCLTCHGVNAKVVGPGLREIAAKHSGRPDVAAYLHERIVKGAVGVWGPIPMPAQNVPEADARAIAAWIAEGAKAP